MSDDATTTAADASAFVLEGDGSDLDAVTKWITGVRRHLHQYPELSLHEEKTSSFVFSLLEQLGLKPRRMAQYGVVADIPGQVDKPFVALRADLDALPVTEETGLPFASKIPGVMHACGHDGHTSMLLGAAAILLSQVKAGNKPKLPVRLVFQPAEENVAGAKAMVAAGVLEDVAAIFGGHIDRSYPVGTIIVHDGCVNASADLIDITFTGKSCHAARPHEGVDTIVMASSFVMKLQHIVARAVDPSEPAVVTIGKMTAGTAFNIVAGSAHLLGTIRATRVETRDAIRERVRRLAESVAHGYGGTVDVAFRDSVPPVINTSSLYPLAQDAARAATAGCGEDASVRPLPKANLGGEDFAEYLQHVPGFFVRYGAGFPGEPNYSAHTAKWDFNEDCMIIGSQYLAQTAVLAGAKLANQ
ncbi:amidohydrolase [Salpingoeca rosetta]|uniref:Amidohydrolase n=1 Tax=Salpingoeca rosetta (strain ATCC 50818 / BSB-021) TaxID=946362 RepID=F2U0X7_SALR5|nr:amidohydrolase [Salpingoeca rosetta]EGD80551.1 amidohydrolase [Salpingoeca rosetta]|eukprot:XP_004997112.1 amidohydrolase [Salpingoeca rosetta]